MADLTETRRLAWATRRAKYGERGHSGSYSRSPDADGRIERMTALIVRLHHEGVLSEGQAAKATGLDRVELRRRVDTMEAEHG